MDLNQITLPARDMDASIAFYQALGLKLIVHTHAAYARFECPMGGSTLSLRAVEAGEPAGGTWIYFEVADVDAEITRLETAGFVIETAPTDHSWLWREAWLRDPSGNRIAIYHAGLNRRFPPWRKEEADS